MNLKKRVLTFLFATLVTVSATADDAVSIKEGKLYTQTLVGYPDAEKEAYIKTRVLQFNKTLPVHYNSDITFSKIYPNHYTIRGTYVLHMSQQEVKKRSAFYSDYVVQNGVLPSICTNGFIRILLHEGVIEVWGSYVTNDLQFFSMAPVREEDCERAYPFTEKYYIGAFD